MKKLLFLILLLAVGCGKSTLNQPNELIISSIIAGQDVVSGDPVDQSTVAVADCSGTIISENLIVTAAHCVGRFERGKFTTTFIIDQRNSFHIGDTTYDQVDISIHPNYKKRSLSTDERAHYDIAIIKLSKKIQSAYYKPTPILDPSIKLQAHSDLLLAGFGGQTGYNKNFKKDSTPLQKITEEFSYYEGNYLAIKQHNRYSGAYHGDSGGPAYLETINGLILVGSACGMSGDDLVAYLNLPVFKDFILKSAKQMNATPPVFVLPE